MCLPKPPKVEPATQYQASKDPVRRDDAPSKKGRRGTILTGGIQETSTGGKKTALGA